MVEQEIRKLFIAPIKMTAGIANEVKSYCLDHNLRIPELILICLLRQIGKTDEQIKSIRATCYPFQPKGRKPELKRRNEEARHDRELESHE